MAMTKIPKGAYWLFIDPSGPDGTDYNNVICLSTLHFNMTSSTNTAETFCGPTSSPGAKTTSVDFSGDSIIDPDTGEISAPDIFDLMNTQAPFSWKIGRLTPVTGDMTKKGNGFFASYDENYTASDVGKFSGNISVDGDVTQVIQGAS